MVTRISLFIFAMFFSISLMSATYDPTLDWQTVETNHFIIHYNEKDVAFAAKISVISETVHEKLVPFMKWEPKEKTQIVLVDNTDMTNGYSTPFPQDHIVLFLVPPPPDSILNNYDDWLELVFTHEYTHTLHLDQHGGIFTVFRNLFGKVFFNISSVFTTYPVLLFPTWIHESIAVYNETKFTGKGRGNSSYTELIINTSVLEDNFPSLSQLQTPPPKWPSGLLPYIYGEKFFNYLIDTYGKDYIYKTFRLERNFIFPFWIEINSLFASHSLMEIDWLNWKNLIKKRLKKDKIKLLHWKFQWLTEPLWSKPAPVVDRNSLFFVMDNEREYPRLYKKNLITGKLNELTKGSVLPYISIDNDGNNIIYSKINYVNNYYYLSDLYMFDLKNNREKRLTNGKRLLYPVFINNDIWAIKIALNNVVLTKLSKHKEIYYIAKEIKLPKNIRYAAFLQYDKKNNRLLFTVNHSGQIDVVTFSIKSHEITYLTNDKFVELYPKPASDGVVFTSDRNGKGFNIYKISCDSIYLLTDGFNGFFNFSFSEDSIYAGYYTSRGFRLVKVPLIELENKLVGKITNLDKVSKKNLVKGNCKLKYTPKSYNLLRNINISSITPTMLWNKYYWKSGINISGGDVLYFINYNMKLSYNNINNNFDTSFSVSYDKYNPSISFAGGTETDFYTITDENNNKTILPNESRYIYLRLLNSQYLEDNLNKYLVLTYLFSKETVFDKSYNSQYYYQGSLHLTLLFNSAGYFPEIKGLNDGFYGGLTFFTYNSLLGSTFESTGFVTDIKKARSFLKGTVMGEVYLGALGGLGKNMKRIELGENLSSTDINGFSLPSEDSFNFYGYPPGTIKTNSLAAISLELREPVWKIDRGLGTIPFWLGEVWFHLFSQHVVYSANKLDLSEYKGNIGMSLNTNMVIGHLLGPIYLYWYVVLDLPEYKLYYNTTLNMNFY